MFTKLNKQRMPRNIFLSYILLGGLVILLAGCPSASTPEKPSATPASQSGKSSQSYKSTKASPMPNTSTEDLSSSPAAGNTEDNNRFEEPWADISDNGGNIYKDNGNDPDSDISPANESHFESDPNFSEIQSGIENKQTDALYESNQTTDITSVQSKPKASVAAPVMSDKEKVFVFDEQLDNGTAEFDEMILAERKVIRNSANVKLPEIESTNGTSNDYPGSAYDSGNGETSAVAKASRSAPQVQNRKGEYSQTNVIFPPPVDIPKGNDDDVVARQLREAAIREIDPELRAKLWEEYRKYKGIK